MKPLFIEKGYAWSSCMGHCATSQKITVSNLDVVLDFSVDIILPATL
jgi:hypothetical protein